MDVVTIIVLIVVGLAGGTISGMGMGGGTLLIPLLVIFTQIGQHSAQAINLIAFIPTAVVALVFHIKNGLVEGKHFFKIAVPATLCSVIFSIFSRYINGKNLAVYFGIFLLVLGVYQLVSSIVGMVKAKKSE